MKGRVNCHSDLWNFDMYSYQNYERGRHKNNNAEKRHRFAKAVVKAMDVFLTDKQKYVFVEHTIHHRKLKDIAKELCLNPSTVTRSYQSALETLEKVALCLEEV